MTTTNDEIKALRAREVELLGELQRPVPLERAPDVPTALAAIARREDARRELEAVRAVLTDRIDRKKAAERDRVASHELRHRVERLEADLAAATAHDTERGLVGSVSAAAPRIAADLEHVRGRLARLEAEGATSA